MKRLSTLLLAALMLTGCSQKAEEEVFNKAQASIKKTSVSQNLNEERQQLFEDIRKINDYYTVTYEPKKPVIENDCRWALVVGSDMAGLLSGARVGVRVGAWLTGVTMGLPPVAGLSALGICAAVGTVGASLVAYCNDKEVSYNENSWELNLTPIVENQLLEEKESFQLAVNWGKLHNAICTDLIKNNPNVKFNEIPKEELNNMILCSYRKYVSESHIGDDYSDIILKKMLQESETEADCPQYAQATALATECQDIFLGLDNKELREKYVREIAEISTAYYEKNSDLLVENYITSVS